MSYAHERPSMYIEFLIIFHACLLSDVISVCVFTIFSASESPSSLLVLTRIAFTAHHDLLEVASAVLGVILYPWTSY